MTLLKHVKLTNKNKLCHEIERLGQTLPSISLCLFITHKMISLFLVYYQATIILSLYFIIS